MALLSLYVLLAIDVGDTGNFEGSEERGDEKVFVAGVRMVVVGVT